MPRLLELALKKKFLVISSCVLSVVSVALSLAPFVCVYYIVREIAMNYADLAGIDSAYLLKLGWIAAGSAAGAILLNFAALMFSHFAAFSTLYILKLDFLRHVGTLPLGFHNKNSTGKLRKVVDVNIEKLETFIAHQLPDLAGSIAMPLATLVILFVFDWRLGIASVIPIALSLAIAMGAMGTKEARGRVTKFQDALEDMNGAAVEYVRGISVVKAFNQTVYSFRKFYESIKTYGEYVMDYTLSMVNHMTIFMVLVSNVYVFLIPAIVLFSGGADDYGEFAMASIFYLIFSMSLIGPFTKIMFTSSLGMQISDGIMRMDRALDIPPLAETSEAKPAAGYAVEFENVTFSYENIADDIDEKAGAESGGLEGEGEGIESIEEDRSVTISDVSFTCEQGKVTALVGPSGGGKSTLAHLIPRFYDAQSGAVKIGGTDIRDMGNEYLMSILSFVFQDVFLFKQSIADNIAVGKKGATREEIIRAAEAAQCDEFARKLPAGYDSIIGGDGIHFSGGEMQRIVIARAILKDAPIIVLDEATAFADPENEQKIQLAFEKLMKGKTVIIIAHRLSTVRGANKIVVIDKGRVAETGRHEDLVRAGGRYAKMWKLYNEAAEWTLGGSASRKHSSRGETRSQKKEKNNV
jgi:ATP-binding cassette subfamily B protein